MFRRQKIALGDIDELMQTALDVNVVKNHLTDHKKDSFETERLALLSARTSTARLFVTGMKILREQVLTDLSGAMQWPEFAWYVFSVI